MKNFPSYRIRVAVLILVIAVSVGSADAAPMPGQDLVIRERIVKIVKSIWRFLGPTTNTDTVSPPKP